MNNQTQFQNQSNPVNNQNQNTMPTQNPYLNQEVADQSGYNSSAFSVGDLGAEQQTGDGAAAISSSTQNSLSSNSVFGSGQRVLQPSLAAPIAQDLQRTSTDIARNSERVSEIAWKAVHPENRSLFAEIIKGKEARIYRDIRIQQVRSAADQVSHLIKIGFEHDLRIAADFVNAKISVFGARLRQLATTAIMDDYTKLEQVTKTTMWKQVDEFTKGFALLGAIPDPESRDLILADKRLGLRNAVAFIRQQVVLFQNTATETIRSLPR